MDKSNKYTYSKNTYHYFTLTQNIVHINKIDLLCSKVTTFL